MAPGLGYFLKFWYTQHFTRPQLPTDRNFKGRTVIITGANVGLGFEAARHIVQMGASKVILAVRSVDKGEAAIADIEASTKTSGCHSALRRDFGIGYAILKFVMGAWSTEQGSRTLVDGVCKGPESHGKYLASCRIVEPSPFVLSEEGKKTRDRVWKELSEKLEKIQPGVLASI